MEAVIPHIASSCRHPALAFRGHPGVPGEGPGQGFLEELPKLWPRLFLELLPRQCPYIAICPFIDNVHGTKIKGDVQGSQISSMLSTYTTADLDSV